MQIGNRPTARSNSRSPMIWFASCHGARKPILHFKHAEAYEQKGKFLKFSLNERNCFWKKVKRLELMVTELIQTAAIDGS